MFLLEVEACFVTLFPGFMGSGCTTQIGCASLLITRCCHWSFMVVFAVLHAVDVLLLHVDNVYCILLEKRSIGRQGWKIKPL